MNRPEFQDQAELMPDDLNGKVYRAPVDETGAASCTLPGKLFFAGKEDLNEGQRISHMCHDYEQM